MEVSKDSKVGRRCSLLAPSGYQRSEHRCYSLVACAIHQPLLAGVPGRGSPRHREDSLDRPGRQSLWLLADPAPRSPGAGDVHPAVARLLTNDQFLHADEGDDAITSTSNPTDRVSSCATRAASDLLVRVW